MRLQCFFHVVISGAKRPTTPFVQPPENGSYIDIATSIDAVCGLQLDGPLDCTFSFPEEVNDFTLGEQFSSIESHETDNLISTRSILFGNNDQIISGTTMCGERIDGTVQCWDESTVFPGPNGAATTGAELIASFELELDGRVYGSNAVEIFWTPQRNRSVEIIAVGFDDTRLGARAFGTGCN